jgi:hypothetical protein
MITKEELIESGYELVLTSDDGLAFCFKTKSNCEFCINSRQGIIDHIQNGTNYGSRFVLPRPFKDILLFNNFVNQYL